MLVVENSLWLANLALGILLNFGHFCLYKQESITSRGIHNSGGMVQLSGEPSEVAGEM